MTHDAAMRRYLLLVRHAKSAWDDPSLVDHDRPLAPRGRKAVPRLCEYLVRQAHHPEIVMCSSSRRTVETLAGIRASIPQRAPVEVDEAFYAADASALLAQLREVDSDISSAMVIGHNPAIQDLAVLLAGAGDPDLRAQLAVKVPTGSSVTLSFEGAWADLAAQTARIDGLFMPRPPRM